MPRLLLAVLLLLASAVATMARIDSMNREEDVAAAPRGAYQFAAAPSTAGEASPARRRFIARADRTCVRTDNRGHARQAAYARRVAGLPDARERVTSFYVRWHTGQYRALRALGEPPEARLDYRRWLDDFATRVRLEARYVPLMRAGRAAEAQALTEEVGTLKARGNLLGQRFGLRLCTSNGPGPGRARSPKSTPSRTPGPV